MAHENLLLVEGRDDQYVIREVARYHDINSGLHDRIAPDQIKKCAFLIKQKEGFERLRREIPSELKASNLTRMGIVVDADDPNDPNSNVSNRWQSLCQVLKSVGQADLQDEPKSSGTIVELDQEYRTLRVGIWLMPDNNSVGALEDFLETLIPDRDIPQRLWRRAKDCVDGIPAEERLFSDRDVKKAYVYTWLAWQRKPGKQTGIAINAGFLDAGAPSAQEMIHWLTRLFELE